MSIVKNIPEDITRHEKRKARRSLRRSKTEQIKQKRMKLSKILPYSYRYYVVDSKDLYERYQVTVPETWQAVKHWESFDREYTDDKGRTRHIKNYKLVLDYYRFIPAHTKSKSRKIGEIKCKPYLKECIRERKWNRKQAIRAVRHLPNDIDIQKSDYKKICSLW